MTKNVFIASLAMFILLAGSCLAAQDRKEIIIKTDKNVYSVGDTIHIKVSLRDGSSAGSGGYAGNIMMFPEFYEKGGAAVEKMGTGDMSDRVSGPPIKSVISGNERVFEFSWKIEDKEWKNVLMDETIYKGPALEAGVTLAGPLVYCFGDLPSEYELVMVWFQKTVMDHYTYKVDPADPNQVISNRVKIKIMPAAK